MVSHTHTPFHAERYFLARRATERLEFRIFDAEERGVFRNQRAVGLRKNRERKAFSVLSAHRKAMIRIHPNVPDGNSESSVFSVLKINHARRCVRVTQDLLGHAEPQRGIFLPRRDKPRQSITQDWRHAKIAPCRYGHHILISDPLAGLMRYTAMSPLFLLTHYFHNT